MSRWSKRSWLISTSCARNDCVLECKCVSLLNAHSDLRPKAIMQSPTYGESNSPAHDQLKLLSLIKPEPLHPYHQTFRPSANWIQPKILKQCFVCKPITPFTPVFRKWSHSFSPSKGISLSSPRKSHYSRHESSSEYPNTIMSHKNFKFSLHLKFSQ